MFDLAFSPSDSRLIASASDDDTAKIWLQSEEGGDFMQVSSFHGHTDSVLRVSWAPDGRLLASGLPLERPNLPMPDLVLPREQEHIIIITRLTNP